MSETATPPAPSIGGSIKDMASILENFVPKSEYGQLFDAHAKLESELAKLQKQYEGIDLKKLQARNVELEGKVRTHNYQAAYKGLVDKLGINPDFADEVFELAKLTIDQDEPDVKKMTSVLKDFLELKPKFKAPTEEKGDQQPAQQPELINDPFNTPRPKLHTAETGRGGQGTPPGKFVYRGSNLKDPDWMRVNGVAYAKAVGDGSAHRAGD